MRSTLACLFVAATLAAAGCAGTEEPAVTEPTTAAAEPTAEAVSPTPVAPEAAAAFSVKVQNMTRGPDGPAHGPVALTATSGLNEITVHVASYTTYCSPAPSFAAEVKGESLVLTVQKATTPVSKCFSPATFDAVVALPGRNNVRQVELVSTDGKSLATAPVTAGK